MSPHNRYSRFGLCVLCYHSRAVNGSCLGVWPTPSFRRFQKKSEFWCEGRVGFKQLSLTGGKQMCVRGEEWLTDDKEALASILLLDLPAAKNFSSYTEQTKICRFSDAEAAVRRPSVRTLSEEQQEAVTTQPEIQAPQHCSSFPATIDSANIQQHCRSSSSATLPLYCLPLPPPRLPSYAQSLAKSQFCYSECPPDPPAYTSSAVVSQPLSVPWTPVSAGKSHPNQVLRRIQSFTSSMSCGGASSLPSTMQRYSQKLSRPTSTIQGTTITICRSALDVGQSIWAGVKNIWCIHTTCILHFFFFLFSTSVTKRSDSSKLKSNSVGTFKEHTGPEQAQSNQQAFISALQQLADKQAARRYASSSHINLLTQHVSPRSLFVSLSVLKITESEETGTWSTRDTQGGFLFIKEIIDLILIIRKTDTQHLDALMKPKRNWNVTPSPRSHFF